MLNWAFDAFSQDLWPAHLVFAFIFGAAWGSFFGLCIARIPAGQSIVHPGSYCFSCGRGLKYADNIPLFSYWIRGGRCRWCGTIFSSRHFWIEMLSGALFAWAFWERGYTSGPFPSIAPPIIAAWVFTGLMVISTFTDLDHWIIPDGVSLGGIVLGVALAFIPWGKGPENLIFDQWPFRLVSDAWWVGPANSLAGAAFGYTLMWGIGKLGTWLFRKEAMGGGDMKLFACIGAFLGMLNCVYVLMIASMLAIVVTVSLLGVERLRAAKAPKAAAPAQGVRVNAEKLVEQALNYLFPEENAQDFSGMALQRNSLLNLLTQPEPGRALRHHLPFGPYLAAAAYLTMLYYDEIWAYWQRATMVY